MATNPDLILAAAVELAERFDVIDRNAPQWGNHASATAIAEVLRGTEAGRLVEATSALGISPDAATTYHEAAADNVELQCEGCGSRFPQGRNNCPQCGHADVRVVTMEPL